MSINNPNLSHSLLHKYSPMPVDLLFIRPIFPVNPFSNTLSISLLGIPIPLSSIINLVPFFISIASILIFGHSFCLYFIAFTII